MDQRGGAYSKRGTKFYELGWGQLHTEPLSQTDFLPHHISTVARTERISSIFFWRRPLIETETSRSLLVVFDLIFIITCVNFNRTNVIVQQQSHMYLKQPCPVCLQYTAALCRNRTFSSCDIQHTWLYHNMTQHRTNGCKWPRFPLVIHLFCYPFPPRIWLKIPCYLDNIALTCLLTHGIKSWRKHGGLFVDKTAMF